MISKPFSENKCSKQVTVALKLIEVGNRSGKLLCYFDERRQILQLDLSPQGILHQFLLSLVFIISTMQRRIQGRRRSSPLKPAKVTLFTIILQHSEKNIRDIGPFCRPLFFQSVM